MNKGLLFKLKTLALGVSLASSVMANDTTTLINLEQANHHNIYKVHFTDLDLAHKAVISFHESVLQTQYDNEYLVMELTEEQKGQLASFGFTFSAANEWVAERSELLNGAQPQTTMSSAMSNIMAGIPGYSCYETVEESFAEAAALASANPTLVEWKDIGDSWRKTQGMSNGHDLNLLKLTNQNISGTKPILFLNSAIHAREYTTAPLTLIFAQQLVNNYGVDADATWILDHHEVHILLQTNPDGRKEAEKGVLWRKNANTNHCSNGWAGVDLNRNFTHTWDNPAGGSSDDQCSQTYRGTGAASEPEVNYMENYMRSIFADRRGPGENDKAPDDVTGIHLDIHSSGGLVLWPWGYTSNAAPNGTQLQTLGRKLAFFNGYEPKQSIGLYPTRGTSKSISYGELGIPGFTIELGTEFFEKCNVFTNDIVPDNLPMLMYAAKAVRAPYVTAQGPEVHNLALNGSTGNVVVTPGTQVSFSLTADDSRHSTRKGTEPSQTVSQVEYYIDTPFWNGGTAIAMSADDGNFNETTETATHSIDTTGWAEGKYMLMARAKDSNNVWGVYTAKYLEINNNPPIEYCDIASNSASDEWIGKVDIGSFSNSSGAAKYTDFTAQTISLAAGASNVTLTPAFSGSTYNEHWKIWVDLNVDGDFDDAGETLFTAGPSKAAVTGSISLPTSAVGTTTRMRIAMKYNAAPSSCESASTFTYGEVEDYTVTITEGGDTGGDVFENTTDYAIPDNNSTGASSAINVVRSGNAGNVDVAVDISHTYKGDLVVDLIAPSGTVYNLHNKTGGSANDIKETYSVNAGSESANGTWKLKAVDTYAADTGTINGWSITFK